MFEIENHELIHYKTEKFILLTTTKKFFQDNNILEEKLGNFNLPRTLQSYLSEEKLTCLLKFVQKLRFVIRNKTLLFCEQVHGENIVTVDYVDISLPSNTVTLFIDGEKINCIFFPKTDGIISLVPNTAIVIFTADCVPLFVYDTIGEVFGLIHVGRKGIENKIIDNLAVNLQKISQEKQRFKFMLGPHICPECYLVGGEPYPLAEKIIKTLKSYSFNTENVNSPYCTYHMKDLFFSYRRDKTSYRLLSFICPR